MARTSRARRSSGRRSARTRTSARTGVIEVFTRPEHSLIVRLLGLVVRLRAELTVLAVALTARFWAWPRFEQWIGHTAALLVTTALILGILVVPASRRALSRRWWCMTTRHRLRACFVQTRTMTHHGRLPLLVWSRPSPVGERVRVWLPAGLSVKDLERVTAETAAACWAADVRITPTRSQAALVVVDVIRRDPLTGGALTPAVVDDLDQANPYVGFDLADQDEATGMASTGTDGPRGANSTGGTVVPLPSRSTLPSPTPRGDAPDTGTPGTTATSGQNGARTRTRKTPAPAGDTASASSASSTDDPPVTGFGGLDVSDYV
jgi:hypothetical protein